MAKKYKVFKSFINSEDSNLLNDWIIDNKIKFSDGRMKEDMSYLYTSDEGHNVYSFKYKGNDTVYSGVIAQEVLDVKPEAVSNINGKLAVDYSRIDVNMEVL